MRFAWLTVALLAACSTPPANSDLPSYSLDAAPVEAGAVIDAPAIMPEAGPLSACTPLAPRSVPLEVAALPDAGEAPFVNALTAATKSIRVMVYQMGYGGILTALEEKAKAGVNVRVVLDVGEKDTNQKYFDSLLKAGASVIWSDSKFPYMHAKVLIVDDSVAVISTGNYSKSYMQKERNFVATDRDPEDLQNLIGLFESDWTRTDPSLSCTRLLVSPVNARKRLIDFINDAKTEVLVESMQLSDNETQEALLARAKAGATVRIILADPSWIDSNVKAAEPFKKAGIDIRWLKAPSVHVKAMVVDRTAAYMGSENFSSTSLSKNREVGVLLDEVNNIDLMAKTFETDWALATKF